jgi:hypothetical protein
MAITTFQGPVRSLNGFYTQGPGNVVTLPTGGNTALTVKDHAGKLLVVGGTLAANRTITLPAINTTAAPGTAGPGTGPNTRNNQGAVFTFYVATTIATSSLKIGTNGTDKYIGFLSSIDTDSSGAMAGFVPGASNDFINLNGGTTGGVVGTLIQITALSALKYFVEGVILCTGNPATPFADS